MKGGAMHVVKPLFYVTTLYFNLLVTRGRRAVFQVNSNRMCRLSTKRITRVEEEEACWSHVHSPGIYKELKRRLMF